MRLPTQRGPSTKLIGLHEDAPNALETTLNALADLPVTSTGYTGKRVKAMRDGEVWPMDELLEEGFEVFDWDGR